MDAAEPPRIVFESQAKCSDRAHAQALLDEALERARAPRAGWSVSMRIGRAGSGKLRADGQVTDEAGAAVGHRVFERKASDCSGLAKAMGVWASLVLDAEVHRPHPIATSDESSSTPESAAAADVQPGLAQTAKLRPAALGTDAQPSAFWPESSPTEKLTPDHDATAHRDESRDFELGAGAFLMSGTGAGLIAGVTPFAVIETGRGLFIRPALVVGQALPSSGPDATLVVARFDGCLRVAGLYTSSNGMQLDLCGGTDAGALSAGHTSPYVGIGPSVDLRGELGGDLAVALRGLFDVNVVQVHETSAHSDPIDTSLVAGRVELAMSWRLQ